MKTICYRNSEGKCDQCGEQVPFGVIKICPVGAKPVKHWKCEWRGEATEELALVECATCCGNVRKKRVTYDCAKFGTCVPLIAGGSVVPNKRHPSVAQMCFDCEFNPNGQKGKAAMRPPVTATG